MFYVTARWSFSPALGHAVRLDDVGHRKLVSYVGPSRARFRKLTQRLECPPVVLKDAEEQGRGAPSPDYRPGGQPGSIARWTNSASRLSKRLRSASQALALGVTMSSLWLSNV